MPMSSPTESLLSVPPRAVVSGSRVRLCQEDERTAVSGATVSRWVGWGRWMFRHRGWLFTPLGGILLLQALATYGTGGLHQQGGAITRWGASAGLLVLGLAIRVYVAGRARPGTSSRGVTFEAGQLITTGMYAYVRNPLYLANLMIWAGLALLAAPMMWWAGLLVGLAGGVYHLIVLAEEEYLAARYPAEYARYRHEVPRWLPRLPRLFRTGRSKNPSSLFPKERGRDGAVVVKVVGISDREDVWDKSLSSQNLPILPNRTESAAHSEPRFTWRRALFREADSLMLVLLAGWLFAGLGLGKLPWQMFSGTVGPLGLGLLAAAAIGWGWIKWLKKRSWPHSTKHVSQDRFARSGWVGRQEMCQVRQE